MKKSLRNKKIKDIELVTLETYTNQRLTIQISSRDACHVLKCILLNSKPGGVGPSVLYLRPQIRFVDKSQWTNGKFVLTPQELGIIPHYSSFDDIANDVAMTDSREEDILLQSIFFLTFAASDLNCNTTIEINDENYTSGKELIDAVSKSDRIKLEEINCDGLEWAWILAINISLMRRDYCATRMLLKYDMPLLQSAILFIDDSTPPDVLCTMMEKIEGFYSIFAKKRTLYNYVSGVEKIWR